MPSATRRALVSIAPPAETGTTMVIGRDGKGLRPCEARTSPGARQRPQPDAEIVFGGEVSWRPPISGGKAFLPVKKDVALRYPGPQLPCRQASMPHPCDHG